MCTLFTLFSHNVGAVRQMQSLCVHVTLFSHNVGAVRQMQSLCVHVIYSVSSQRWCCEANAVTVCARYLLCFLTKLVLLNEAVSVCARHLFQVGAVR